MKTLKILILSCLPVLVLGQQEYQITQYMYNGLVINPAYVGTNENPQLNALFRKQWFGFEGAPMTNFLSYEHPMDDLNMGVGGIISLDQIGVTQQLSINGAYAYHLQLNEKNNLSFGLRAGVINYRTKFQDITVWEEDNVYQNQNINAWVPEFGFGMHWYQERLFVGVSVPKIFEINSGNALQIHTQEGPRLNRHLLVNGGYTFDLSEKVSLKPTFLVKYVNGSPISFDINSTVIFKKIFWMGAGYRLGDCANVHLQYIAGKKLAVGYAYDITLSKMRTYSAGSHELMVSYVFGDVNRQTKPSFL